MLGAEHRRERAAADACDDPARAGWFRDLHRGHYENASRLRGGDQPGEMEVVACAEVDNICGENGVPVPEMDAIVLKWLGGKNLED